MVEPQPWSRPSISWRRRNWAGSFPNRISASSSSSCTRSRANTRASPLPVRPMARRNEGDMETDAHRHRAVAGADVHPDPERQPRASLLRNYDPLVEAVAGLYGAVDALGAEAKLGSGEAAADVGRHLDRL